MILYSDADRDAAYGDPGLGKFDLCQTKVSPVQNTNCSITKASVLFCSNSNGHAVPFSYPSEKRKDGKCNLNLRGRLMFIHAIAQRLKEQYSDMSN